MLTRLTLSYFLISMPGVCLSNVHVLHERVMPQHLAFDFSSYVRMKALVLINIAKIRRAHGIRFIVEYVVCRLLHLYMVVLELNIYSTSGPDRKKINVRATFLELFLPIKVLFHFEEPVFFLTCETMIKCTSRIVSLKKLEIRQIGIQKPTHTRLMYVSNLIHVLPVPNLMPAALEKREYVNKQVTCICKIL